jgi:hypothetical protein
VIDCLNDPTHLVAFGDSDNVPFYFTRSKVDEAAIGSMTFQDTPCVKLYAEALIALTNHYDVDPLTVLLSVEEHLIENGLVETASVDDGSVEDESIEDGSEDKEKSPRA